MSGSVVTLLQLCDSLFPVGGFAHSDGLEAATAADAITNASGLAAWLDAVLDGVLAGCDGPAVLGAWEAFDAADWPRLRVLDEEIHAIRPSSAARQASRGMGTRLLRTWQDIRPTPRLARLATDAGGRAQLTFPVAFGVVAASADLSACDAVEGFIYTRLAATISAAMRLAPIGQTEGHRLLSQTLARVPAVAALIMKRRDRPRSFVPMLDIAAMSQQYVHSRLFRS
jgi:urease accessory protein